MEVISQVFFGHVKMYVCDTVTTDKANILKQPLKRNIENVLYFICSFFVLFIKTRFSAGRISYRQ